MQPKRRGAQSRNQERPFLKDRSHSISFHFDFNLCDQPSPRDAVKSLIRMRLHSASQTTKVPVPGKPRHDESVRSPLNAPFGRKENFSLANGLQCIYCYSTRSRSDRGSCLSAQPLRRGCYEVRIWLGRLADVHLPIASTTDMAFFSLCCDEKCVRYSKSSKFS